MKLHILGLLACVVVVGIAVCVLAQSTEPPVVAPVGPTPVLPGQVVPGGPGGIPRVPGGPGVIGTGRDGVDYEALSAQADAMKSFTGSLFDARSAAVTAVYALKDDLKPEEAIKLFTARLEKTKVQGLRNAIHMALRDLYKDQGQDDKASDQLKAILDENAALLQKINRTSND